MKSETLQMSGTLDEMGAMKLAHALNTVDGVKKVAIDTTTASINVDFDDDITSIQVLRASLQRAGISVKKPAHSEEGMCCGSCGS